MAERQEMPRYPLRIDRPVDLDLALDHGQFFVLDRDSEINLDSYDEAAQATGLATFDGGVVVFCESHWSSSTPLRLMLMKEQPAIDPAAHDHVVLGGIVCRSGELRIYSPEETGTLERAVLVEPGTYGLAVCGDGFGQADEYGDNGGDRYRLSLWPAVRVPSRASLKSGLPGA